MAEAYILSACRTPIGRFGGAFKDLNASDLGAVAVKAALQRAGLPAGQVDDVWMGNVIQAAQGQNPARQAALKAGLPMTVPASTVNMVCGSGLRAVVLAAQAVRLGEADAIVAGGMESMSQAPYALTRQGVGFHPTDATLLDLVLRDGLLDAFDGRHMGLMCEGLGRKYGIGREQQDAYAVLSQQRAAAAQKAGRFVDEIVPVTVQEKRETKTVSQDEHPRPDTTVEGLGRLKPAFAADGCVTAGNASGINDGAAALVVVSEDVTARLGRRPLARIVSWAVAAREPEMFGVAPAGAVKKALDKAGLTLADVDLIESNEAFAVQVLALSHEVGWDMNRVNVNGGAIALGHPIGASGARILVTLLHEMQRRGSHYGLATLCCGGGMGIAMVVEHMPI